jgi:hypothetical protein
MDRRPLDQRVDALLDRENRERLAHELDLPSAWDRAVAAVGIGSAILPSLAPAIGELLMHSLPSRRVARVDALLRELVVAVARVEARIDASLAQGDQFADLLEDVLVQAQFRQAEEKRAYYAAALANSLTPERPDAVDQEKMLAALEGLRASHMRMIAVFMTTTLPDSMLPLKGDMLHRVVHGSLEGMTHEQVNLHIVDLQTHGIFPLLASQSKPGDPHELSTELTPFGRRFANWIQVSPPHEAA